MRITITSVLVDDQDKALRFYTEVLGFVKRQDVPLGEARWLTVVSPEARDAPDAIELLLEPLGFEPARTYQRALFDAGIPLTSFTVDDIQQEHQRLTRAGVVFAQPPTRMGPVLAATFQDTCGNLIQMVQHAPQ